MSDRQPRILIIDDDPQLRSLLQALMRKNFLVSVASSGEQGFQKARSYPPDVAVIDVQMEGWDGLRTLQAFRSDSSLANVRIMMLTGDATRDTVTKAIAEGADDYLIKTSFVREEFLEKIYRLCARGSATTSAKETPPTPAPQDRPSAPSAARRTGVSAPISTRIEKPDDLQLIQSLVDHWD